MMSLPFSEEKRPGVHERLLDAERMLVGPEMEPCHHLKIWTVWFGCPQVDHSVFPGSRPCVCKFCHPRVHDANFADEQS